MANPRQMFNNLASEHKNKMAANPFSGSFSKSQTLAKDDPGYGKPVAGSKSEARSKKAAALINSEVSHLCLVIHEAGEMGDDGCVRVEFGHLFQIYTRISSKVVGILLRARKYGFVDFEPEILFQGRDNETVITMLKPYEEIRRELSSNSEFEVGICHKK